VTLIEAARTQRNTTMNSTTTVEHRIEPHPDPRVHLTFDFWVVTCSACDWESDGFTLESSARSALNAHDWTHHRDQPVR
jgi:hypothetical protein